MDFVLVIVVFGVFFLGAVFAYQAFVGKEINPDRTHALRGLHGDKLYVDPDQPGSPIRRSVTGCGCSSSAWV